MDLLQNNLQILGFSREEIQVYIGVLEQGNTTVLQLAKATHIPRTTVYLLVDSLTQKGLLKLRIARKKKYYVAVEPHEILILGKSKQERLAQSLHQLEQEIPQLNALYRAGHTIPQIQHYQGIDEVKKIYEKTLTAEKMYVHCMSQKAMEIMGPYLKKYFIRVVQRMIHTKEIVSDNSSDKLYQQEHATSRNQIICIPSKFATNTDYIIYGDNVVFITYREGQPVGVVIHDKEIAHFEKIRFGIVWKQFSNNKLT